MGSGRTTSLYPREAPPALHSPACGLLLSIFSASHPTLGQAAPNIGKDCTTPHAPRLDKAEDKNAHRHRNFSVKMNLRALSSNTGPVFLLNKRQASEGGSPGLIQRQQADHCLVGEKRESPLSWTKQGTRIQTVGSPTARSTAVSLGGEAGPAGSILG